MFGLDFFGYYFISSIIIFKVQFSSLGSLGRAYRGAGYGLFTTRPIGDGEEVLHLSGDVVWLPENRQALTKASIPAPAGQMANHHNDVNLMQIAVWVDPDPSIPGAC